MNREHERSVDQPRDRREIGKRVVPGPRIEMWIDREGSLVDDDERAPVGCAFRRGLQAEIAAGSRLVLDDHRHTERWSQLLGHPPGAQVHRGPRWRRSDDANRLGRGHNRRHGSKRGNYTKENVHECEYTIRRAPG